MAKKLKPLGVMNMFEPKRAQRRLQRKQRTQLRARKRVHENQKYLIHARAAARGRRRLRILKDDALQRRICSNEALLRRERDNDL